jgi:hypothetical protein
MQMCYRHKTRKESKHAHVFVLQAQDAQGSSTASAGRLEAGPAVSWADAFAAFCAASAARIRWEAAS